MGAMQLWLVSFIVLFLAAEGLDWLGSLEWLKGVDLSLPVAVLGGIGLAIASNSHRSTNLPKSPTSASQPLASPAPQPPAIIQKTPADSSDPSISFEIKPRSPGSRPAN